MSNNNLKDSSTAILEDSCNQKGNYESFEVLKAITLNCHKCQLANTRTNVVFDKGNPEANLLIIGEAPGRHEDEQGLPFVGRSGKLLDSMLESANIDLQNDIYVCNIVKCRPPQNRVPTLAETEACKEYLKAQIHFVKPKMILLCGSTAVKGILKTKIGITKIRGQWFNDVFGCKAMPIFHPSYLLRNPSNAEGSPKDLMLKDLQEVKRELDNLKTN